MSVKLLTEHHLEFLNLKGGCRGSSESTLVKIQLVVQNSIQISEYFEQSEFLLNLYLNKMIDIQ